METLLKADNLQISFRTDQGELICVEDVSFSVKKGETLGIVGESGCGKSVTALSILGLLGRNGRISRGSIELDGLQLTELDPSQWRELRGNKVSMIFQEPMTSLNPVMTVGTQLLEPIQLHLGLKGEAAKALAVDWLRRVGIPRPEKVFSDYPGTLSGGMRQRVMIAMAMVCRPKLLVADEPTTALDVTIQAQILDLVEDLRRENGTAVLLITHDLGVIAESADRVVVMYAGQIVEEADVFTLFRDPQHPYTRGLLASIPDAGAPTVGRLESIPGQVPSLKEMPQGCRFAPRCSMAQASCRERAPELRSIAEGHRVRCPFTQESPL